MDKKDNSFEKEMDFQMPDFPEDETPWEFIEDIPGLSELLEDEDSGDLIIEEYPGLYRLKKKDEK